VVLLTYVVTEAFTVVGSKYSRGWILSKTCTIRDHADRKRNRLIFLLIALFILSWSAVLYSYSPARIVSILGVRNVYIFVMLLAMIGGVSIFTTTLFYTSLVTISLGGVNIIWLSLFASTGLLFGDLVFYYFARTGSQCAPEKYATIIAGLIERVERYSDKKVIFFIFLYSMTPLPSDAISIVLGILSFPVRKMVLPLILGKFILIAIFIELALLGYSFI
jgi:membrane protein YqaA with SNARE-associated domain